MRQRGLLVTLLIAIGAVLAVAALAYASLNGPRRDAVLEDVPKATFTFLLVGVLGVLVKYLVDRHRDERAREEKSHSDERAREEKIDDFRKEMIDRLVEATSRIRRVPMLVEAHRSANAYAEQMKETIDAYNEIRRTRHEIDNIADLAFRSWVPDIRENIRAMERYLDEVIDEFRTSGAEIFELDRKAWRSRRGQAKVWRRIRSLPRIAEMLAEDPSRGATSRFYVGYFEPFGKALAEMRRELLRVPSPEREPEPDATPAQTRPIE
jgi:hypothetical protein